MNRLAEQADARSDGLALRLADAIGRRGAQPALLARCTRDVVAELPEEPRALVLADLDPLSFLRLRLVSRRHNALVDSETRARCHGMGISTLAQILGTVQTEALRSMTMRYVWRVLRPYARGLTPLPGSMIQFRAHRVDSLGFALDRIVCVKRLESVIVSAELDDALLGPLPTCFLSATLNKLHAHHLATSGMPAADDRIRRLLAGLILRQRRRIARLERGECVTISELFHDTKPDLFKLILLGSIDPRMGRDKKPHKGTYVSDQPGQYGHLTFGFPGGLIGARPFWDEPADQQMGYWGFKDRLEVNPVLAAVFDRFAHPVCAAALGPRPSPRRYRQLFRAMTSVYRVLRSGNAWVIIVDEYDQEIPSAYFLQNHLQKICKGITEQEAVRGAQAGWNALATIAVLPNTAGAVTANLSAPAQEDLGLWTSDMSLEDVAGHLQTQGILLLGELIDLASQLVELEYLRMG